jgi:uncharacterized Ntn-hydrolase superfamily protein
MTSALLAVLLGTFSIVAADPATGQVGVAVQSKFPAVGAIVPAARAGVGAVATQSLANVAWRKDALDLLAQGLSAEAVLKKIVAADPQADDRQIGLVDAKGNAAAFTGRRCFDHASHRTGEGYAVQGNILTNRATIDAIADAYEKATAGGVPFAERLLLALEAGATGGRGDRRGQQSAALLVVKPGGGYIGVGDVLVDLRVDDHARPIAELRRLYTDVHQYYFGAPKALVPIDAKLAREIQGHLAKLGFYEGPRTGAFDAATRQALVDWQGWENLEGRIREGAEIDALVLAHLRRLAREKRDDKAR